ncbi:MAG TPA: hypothetical protein VFJ23_01105 [Candidatus Nitrosotalea sp.]|nr:hypothetical protein [Candidatus Nitrosotalea sp.]
MKTLYFSIIIGTGIAVAIIVSFMLFFMMSGRFNQHNSEHILTQENSSDVKLTVSGLNDTYLVGQRINFNITTTAKGCSWPHVIVTRENGSILWNDSHNPMFCDTIANSGPQTWNWNFDNGSLGSLAIRDAGTYKMTISFHGNTMEKDLRINP